MKLWIFTCCLIFAWLVDAIFSAFLSAWLEPASLQCFLSSRQSKLTLRVHQPKCSMICDDISQGGFSNVWCKKSIVCWAISFQYIWWLSTKLKLVPYQVSCISHRLLGRPHQRAALSFITLPISTVPAVFRHCFTFWVMSRSLSAKPEDLYQYTSTNLAPGPFEMFWIVSSPTRCDLWKFCCIRPVPAGTWYRLGLKVFCAYIICHTCVSGTNFYSAFAFIFTTAKLL